MTHLDAGFRSHLLADDVLLIEKASKISFPPKGILKTIVQDTL
jgi:hypothetical protein